MNRGALPIHGLPLTLSVRSARARLQVLELANAEIDDDECRRLMEHITVNKRLLENEVASVNFDVTNTTPPWDGRFHMQLPAAPGWNVLVRHTMWRDAAAKRSGWFGFNLRISRRSVAPRPFLLFDLEPEQSVSVSHRYEFDWRPQL